MFHIIIFILISLMSLPLPYAQKHRIIAQNGCKSKCGAMSIPFPFGMEEPHCYAGKWFEIECKFDKKASDIPKPYLKSLNLEVTNFDDFLAMIEIMNPVHHSKCQNRRSKNHQNNKHRTINLRDSPFVYSHDFNQFLAVGCNNFASLQSNGTTVGGCTSVCANNYDNFDLPMDGCEGTYCCETSVPLHLSEFNARLQGIRKNNSVECSYALIVSRAWITFNGLYMRNFGGHTRNYSVALFNDLKSTEYAPAMLEWEILTDMLNNSTFQLPPNCYKSNVTSLSNKITGRRCRCPQGYTGNPYVIGGCAEIPEFYSKKKWAIVGISSSLGSIGLLAGLWFLYKAMKQRMIMKRKQKFFKRNGGLFLEEKMCSGEVNIDGTNIFTKAVLEKATENFNQSRILGKGGQGTVYKGMLVDGKVVAVKKSKVDGEVEQFINELVILSQINNRNVVKILGCCLEAEIPLLVYEFIPNGTLSEYLHGQNEAIQMTWQMRLRIATEIAGALFYLHSVASQPIYHRDVKSTNILLDENYRAKLADFGLSRIIPIDATHLSSRVCGTVGYMDPEYQLTGMFTEKSDIFSFGVVLAELLTSKKAVFSLGPGEERGLAQYFVECLDGNKLPEIIDRRVTEDVEEEQVISVASLAYRCLDPLGRNRPTMKEAMLELERIRGTDLAGNEENHLLDVHSAYYSASTSLQRFSSQRHSRDSESLHILSLESEMGM